MKNAVLQVVVKLLKMKQQQHDTVFIRLTALGAY